MANGMNSIDPAALAAQQQIAQNQAKKSDIELQNAKLAQDAQVASQQMALQKEQMENAARENQLNRQSREQGFRDKQSHDLMMQKQGQQYQDQRDERQRKDDLEREKIRIMLSSQNFTAMNNKAQSQLGFVSQMAASAPSKGSVKDMHDYQNESRRIQKEHAKSLSENTIKQNEIEAALKGNNLDFNDNIVKLYAEMEKQLLNLNQLGEGAASELGLIRQNMFTNPELISNIFTSFDIDAATRGDATRAGRQAIEDALPGSMLDGSIAVPAGTAAEDLAGYDFMFGPKGVLTGVQSRDGVDKSRLTGIADRIDSYIGEERSNEGIAVRDLLVKRGFSNDDVAGLGLGRDDAWVEGMTKQAGVTREEWIEAKALKAAQQLGQELTVDEAARLDNVSKISASSGYNPLFQPEAIQDLRGETSGYSRGFSLNPFGQVEEVYATANSGDSSLQRFAGHTADDLNRIDPGLGDAFLSSISAINKYKANKTDATFKVLQQELTDISKRTGGEAFVKLNAMFDSLGQQGVAEMPEGLTEGMNQSTLNAMQKGYNNFNKAILEVGGIFNNAIGGGYGGSATMVEGTAKALSGKIKGLLQNGQIGQSELEDMLYKSAADSMGVALEGAPEGVVEELVGNMFKDLDMASTLESAEGVRSDSAALKELITQRGDADIAKDDQLLALDQEYDIKAFDRAKAEEDKRKQDALDAIDRMINRE